MASTAALVALVLLAFVHLAAAALKFVAYVPRSRWLSFAGGVPVAFVFVELLPSLARTTVAERVQVARPIEELLPYLAALVGLALYYGVEHVVKRDKATRAGHATTVESADEEGHGTGRGAFWFGIGSYALLNYLVGYVLVFEERPLVGMVLFALAVALKFMVTDRSLYEDHRHAYRKVGRWLVIAAFLLGGLTGLSAAVPDIAMQAFRAFLTGGILLVVIKEELPQERSSSWGAFALGAGIYAALVLGAELVGADTEQE